MSDRKIIVNKMEDDGDGALTESWVRWIGRYRRETREEEAEDENISSNSPTHRRCEKINADPLLRAWSLWIENARVEDHTKKEEDARTIEEDRTKIEERKIEEDLTKNDERRDEKRFSLLSASSSSNEEIRSVCEDAAAVREIWKALLLGGSSKAR